MQRKYLAVLLTVLCVFILGVLPAHADSTHVVQAGENLRRIAAQYGTTVPAIVAANDLRSPDVIYAGQRLRIPTDDVNPASPNPDTYVVQSGDTLFSIARRFGVTQRALMQANGISDPTFIWAGQQLRILGVSTQPAPVTPTADQSVHLVARGETLFSIAARYGATVSSIAQANGLRAANHVVASQRLIIPGSEGGPAVDTPTQGKWIEVDLGRQRLVAYAGDRPLLSTVVSTGKPSTPTVQGRFTIRAKLRSQRMVGPEYNLPNVPWVMYFHETYALHGTYWHNEFGRPVSHGCVNMHIPDAQWLYNWASVGTPVVIHE